MQRLPRAAAALAMTVTMSLAVSAGPAFAEGAEPPASPTTSAEAPVPTTTEPPPPASEPSQPTRTEPSPTTEPSPSQTPGTAEPAPVAPAPSTSTSSTPPPVVTENQPDLRLTVVLDKPSYVPQDLIKATATVANAGTGTATAVKLTSSDNLTNHTWDGFTDKDVTIDPGQSVVGTAVGWVANVADEVVRLNVQVTSAEPDADPTTNSVTVTAPLIVARGSVTGIAYGDHNSNGVMDAGEELAGLRVLASGLVGHFETRTDSDGRFTFRELLEGDWSIFGDTPEWVMPGVNVHVDGVHNPQVTLQGQYDMTGWLTGSARFTEPIHAKGDTARMVVVLTNSGKGPIPGLSAGCQATNHAEFDLGELSPSGPGATVPAWSSRSFEITVPVDAQAANAGYLQADCWIDRFNPYAMISVRAVTHVPGARAAKVRVVLLTRDLPRCACGIRYVRVPGVKVYLRNQVTGAIVARAVSGPDGKFVLYDVPADLYDVGLVGPWRATSPFAVSGDDNGSTEHPIIVAPGPFQPDPDPAPIPPPAAAPGPVPPPPLAETGASVTWLALGGLLTLLAGVILVFGTGRRRRGRAG